MGRHHTFELSFANVNGILEALDGTVREILFTRDPSAQEKGSLALSNRIE